MKVLLVDDAAFVRMSLKKILNESKYEFEFIEASDGEDATPAYSLLLLSYASMRNANNLWQLYCRGAARRSDGNIPCSIHLLREKVYKYEERTEIIWNLQHI